MTLWRFHEAYKALDLKAIDGYPNKCLVNQFDLLPNFDGNPLSAVAHFLAKFGGVLVADFLAVISCLLQP
jgi:hypothetical protein